MKRWAMELVHDQLGVSRSFSYSLRYAITRDSPPPNCNSELAQTTRPQIEPIYVSIRSEYYKYSFIFLYTLSMLYQVRSGAAPYATPTPRARDHRDGSCGKHIMCGPYQPHIGRPRSTL